MKNKKQQNVPETEAQISELSIGPGVAVMAGAMVLIFALLFLVLWRSDSVTLYFAGIFPSSNHAAEGNVTSEGEVFIPAETDVTFSEDYFYTPNLGEKITGREAMVSFLETVRKHDAYEQTFLVSYGNGAPEMISVLRNGEKYRVETSDSLIVCDGHTVYMRRIVDGGISFENRWNVDEGAFSLENEVGFPSFEEILSGITESETEPNMTFDERKKTVLLRGIMEDDLIKTVTLTYETGMILSASVEEIGGTVMCEINSIFYTLDPEFGKDAFTIPMS